MSNYYKEWTKKNSEYQRRYYQEKVKPFRKKKVLLTDEEKIERRKQSSKKYYEKNKEIINEKNKKYSKKRFKKLTEEERIKKNKYQRDYYHKNKNKNKLLTEEQKKENLKISQKKYYEKNKDIISIQQKKYRSQRKELPSIDTKKFKLNIKDNELRYELILSKGKGTPSEKLQNIFYEMSVGINTKFNYIDEDVKHDVIVEGYISAMKNWQNFNENKYKKAFPYITEIIKRGQAMFFNKWNIGGITGNMNEIKNLNVFYYE